MEAEAEADIAHETALHELQTRIDELEQLRNADADELRALRQSEQAAHAQLADIKEQNERLKLDSENDKQNAANAETEKQRADASNRQLLDALARADQDKQALEVNVSQLKESLNATQASLRAIETAYTVAAETERSHKLRLQSLEGELEILKKDRDWNHDELQRVSDDAARDRRDKNTQISSLQTKLDSATSSLESATASLTSLKASKAQVDARLDQALARVSDLTSQLADEEASFRAEISTSQKLVELLQHREEETKARLDEVEREWESAQRQIEESRQGYEAAVEKERQRADVLEERVREMREFADRLAGNGLPIAGVDEDVFGTPAAHSPSASNVSFRLQKAGGKSYTEIYTSYVKVQEELQLERAESARLSEALTLIMHEIKERAPLLKEQRAEYERATAENNELSIALARTLEERDEQARLAEDRRLQIEDKAREVVMTSQQLADLARQVRSLTRRVAILDDPTIADRSAGQDEDEFAQPDGEENANTFITANLVTFASINQLQTQNQNLLKIVRDLGQKMEAEERTARERVTSAESAAVSEAHDLILDLRERLQATQTQLQAYQQEHDMLRQVLKDRGQASSATNGFSGAMSASDASSSRAAVEEVQRNFDAYKRETVADNQTLRDDLANARREVSQLQVDVARLNAQKELQEERYRSLQDTSQRQEKEISDISKRNIDLQARLARQDDRTRQNSDDLLQARAELERKNHEVTVLKAEKQVWKHVEERLTEDNANLLRERTHLSDLMRSLQSMHNDLDSAAQEARKRLEEGAKRLQSELEGTKDRLAQEVENARQLSLRREVDSKDYQDRLDKLSSECRDAREAYLNAKNSFQRSEEHAEALARQVAAYEEKLAVYEGRRRNSGEGSSVDREQQLETQLADLRADLSAARTEVEQAKAHVEQYRAIAESHETALKEQTDTYNDFKASSEAQIAQKNTEIADLQERVNGLTSDLTAANDENSELHRKLEAQRTEFQQEQQTNLNTIAQLRQVESQVQEMRAAAKAELKEASKRAADAHENFQRELVSHAEDIKVLKSTEDSLRKVRQKLEESKSTVANTQAALQAEQASWETQRIVFEKELEEQRKRSQDLAAQNTLLHDHLEKITSQVSRLQENHTNGQQAEDGDVAEPPAEAKTIEELHAVIKYVRREKDVAELRLDLSRQEEARLRQQLQSTSRTLEQKMAELDQERQLSADQAAMQQQAERLTRQEDELKLMRESNSTLRREAEQETKRASKLSDKLAALQTELAPLRERVKVLEAEIEAKDRNIKILEEDNARWKNRTQQILQKYERIDPAELAQLKEELEKVKAQLAEVEKERDAAQSRANAMTTDLNDANTRVRNDIATGFKTDQIVQAEASLERFKKLQQLARKHRDDNNTLSAEMESLKAQIDQLNADKSELQSKLNEAQSSAATAQDEASKKADAEKDEALQKLRAEKEALVKERDEAVSRRDELEASSTKLEENMANLTRRNHTLLQDNKKFRSAALEANKQTAEAVEKEVEKRMAALPQATPAEGTTGADGISKESLDQALRELEQKLTAERDAAVQKAISDTVTGLQSEFEEEKRKLSEELAAASAAQTAQSLEGSGLDEAEIQKRIDQAAEAKVQAAVAAKEEELVKAREAAVANTKKQVEQSFESQLASLRDTHAKSAEKLQKEHDEKLGKAVQEAKASAAPEEGETVQSAEDVEKAIADALKKRDEEHQAALAKRIEQVEAAAKHQFELKAKLREQMAAALRKENTNLKAKLAAQASGETSDPAASPATPQSAFPPAGKSPVPATTTAIPTSTPTKGLSIAGRSQAAASGTPATPAAGRPVGLSIQGAGANASNTAEAGGATAGRGRGARGRGRGQPAGAGRGRGNIVNTALSAATESGQKRPRDDEAPADAQAKRLKDGDNAES